MGKILETITDLEKARMEYLELSREKVDIEREIERDETIIKESRLFKTRDELEKEITKLKSLGKTADDSEVREYDDVYAISYLVSNKGIYYNGLLQDEDELLDYIYEDEFDKEILKILGKEKALKFQEKYDPYIVAAILNNGFDWFEQDPNYIENAKSIRLNKYYNFIINKKANKDINIVYDLRGTSMLLSILGKNILNREFVKEAQEYAYKSRGFANVIVNKITSLKFRMYDVLPRRKKGILTIKYGIDEKNGNRKNNWKVRENYSTETQNNKLNSSNKSQLQNIQIANGR